MKKNLIIRLLSLVLLWLAPVAVVAAEPDLIITTQVTDGAIVVCGNEQTVTVNIKNNTTASIALNGLNLFNTGTNQLQVTSFPSTWKNTGCATGLYLLPDKCYFYQC